MLDKMADRPAAADNLRDRLSGFMKFAIGAGYRNDNLVLFAKRAKPRRPAFAPGQRPI